MTAKFLLIVLSIGLLSCTNETAKTGSAKMDNLAFNALEIREENATPTVNIEKYTLIENPFEDRKNDAKQILDLKRKWPLVMQEPNKAGFDTILSQSFTFYAEGQLLNREDYITDRIKQSEWKIIYVEYDNLTLQFFGNTALLTYRNRVSNENRITKVVEIEYISWAEIYVIENNKWKIGAAHVIDFRLEIQ